MRSASTCDCSLSKLKSPRSSSTRKHAVQWRAPSNSYSEVVEHIYQRNFTLPLLSSLSNFNFDWVLQSKDSHHTGAIEKFRSCSFEARPPAKPEVSQLCLGSTSNSRPRAHG